MADTTPSDVYDPSVQRWYCLACDMEHPPGPCPIDAMEDPLVDPCNYCPHDNTEHAEDGCRLCPCAVPQ